MIKMIFILSVLLPVAAFADMTIPPNAAKTGDDMYKTLDDNQAKTALIQELSGETLKSICQSIKGYLEKWGMTIEINPGQNWVDAVDCDKNKTPEERDLLWQACMFAAHEIKTQGVIQNTRETLLARMFRYPCAFNDGNRAEITCEIGDVTRCVSVESPAAYNNAWDDYMVACCIISPDTVNQIKTTVQGDKVSTSVNAVISPASMVKRSYRTEQDVTLQDFDNECKYLNGKKRRR